MWRSGGYVVALLDYGDFVVTYETGVDDQLRFDAHIEVYGATGTMKVQYDTPYVRHFPTTLELEATVGDSYERSVVRPAPEGPLHLRARVLPRGRHRTAARRRRPPRTTSQDMELFVEIIRAIERS